MGLLIQTPRGYYDGNNFGNYQFTSLSNIINSFIVAYVGEDKIISKIKRVDVAFHAQRALQELSFDTFKSCKAQEFTVPATLQMPLPQDYVNYTKISWVDSAGIKHLLHPTSKTSNPKRYQMDSDNEFLFDDGGSIIPSGEMITNGNFHGGSESWVLNATGSADDTYDTTITESTVGPDIIVQPDTGWFHGYNNNAVGGYNLGLYASIRQLNVPIIAGESYIVTYTLSNYTSGTYNVVIIDEKGDWSRGTTNASNGTFTQTLKAGFDVNTDSSEASYTPQSIYIQQYSTTPGNVVVDNVSIVKVGDENDNTTWTNYSSATPSENQDDYQDDTYWPMDGSRFGLDPQHAQANGSFYIDNQSGKIHFSSNISGKTVILDYISDSLGTDDEMHVHKFAEDAMYKYIIHGIVSTSSWGQQLVPRLTKEKFAAIRKAKLRLSNIKLEELTQILRGKSKQIKH